MTGRYDRWRRTRALNVRRRDAGPPTWVADRPARGDHAAHLSHKTRSNSVAVRLHPSGLVAGRKRVDTALPTPCGRACGSTTRYFGPTRPGRSPRAPARCRTCASRPSTRRHVQRHAARRHPRSADERPSQQERRPAQRAGKTQESTSPHALPPSGGSRRIRKGGLAIGSARRSGDRMRRRACGAPRAHVPPCRRRSIRVRWKRRASASRHSGPPGRGSRFYLRGEGTRRDGHSRARDASSRSSEGTSRGPRSFPMRTCALRILGSLAERVGFEPTGPRGPAVFKTAPLDRSGTSPVLKLAAVGGPPGPYRAHFCCAFCCVSGWPPCRPQRPAGGRRAGGCRCST